MDLYYLNYKFNLFVSVTLVVTLVLCFYVRDISGQAVAPVCKTQEGVCSCMTDRGLIDIRPLDSTGILPHFNDVKDSKTNFMYFYNPCTPFSKGSSPCINAAVCQGLPYPTPTSFWQYGVHTGAVFVTNTTTQKLEIQYSGLARSVISLDCDPSKEGTLTFIEENPFNTARLTLTSKYACPHGGKGGGGGGGGMATGTVLCIVFIVLVSVYLIAGTLYMHFAKGAVGVEKIPNSQFWIQFPGLVKDGVTFVTTPVRAALFGYNKI